MAFGALRAAEELKKSVPRDLGIAGFDHVPHIPYATFMHPELTTVEVPIYELGRAAASLTNSGAQQPRYLSMKKTKAFSSRQSSFMVGHVETS